MEEIENHKLVGKSFPDCVGNTLKNSMESSSFYDVTLVCDDYMKIKSHKVVLTSSSSLFKDILKDDKNISEIFLIGIKSSELESILKFIYLGEVYVHQKTLCNFVSTARNLEFEEIVKTVKESRNEIVETLQHNNSRVKVEKITEVYLKEEEELITDNDDHKDVIQQSKGEKFECDECGAELSSGQTLKKHKTYMHSGKLHPCDQCDYKAKQPGGLKAHKNVVHEGIRRYQCKECDYKASTKQRLSIHMTVRHGGTMLYCSICNISAATKYRLRVHIENVHEKLKKQCSLCDYKVLKNSSLSAHIKSVHEGITYPCNQCEYVGSMKKFLLKHVKKYHSAKK